MPEPGHLDILKDLAVVMIIAGGVVLLFHWIRIPVILGYIIAGVIIGPFTPPFVLINEIEVVNTLAELGVILLMYSLGLEFSLGKLRRVGKIALFGGAFQVLIVFALGYQVGLLLGWTATTAVFLGAGLSISSTALIVKVLEAQRRMSDRASQAVFGVLIFEDFAAIAMIALLSGFGSSEAISLPAIGWVILKVILFLGLSIVVGMGIVPRLMDRVEATRIQELMVIVGLALCFGMALLSRYLGLSVAAGAFVAGALVAESKRGEHVAHLISPIRDMFAALFFVAIGMLLNPLYLLEYWPHILIITAVLIAAKIFAGTIATFLLGYSHHVALRVGMSLAQIGEFSLVIAKVGQDSGVVGDFFYPVIVGVTALSTLTTPFIIGASIHAGERLDKLLGPRMRRYLTSAEEALQKLQAPLERNGASKVSRRAIIGILINLFLFTVINILGRLIYERWEDFNRATPIPPGFSALLITLTIVAIAALPLVAIVHYAKTLVDDVAGSFTAQRSSVHVLTRSVVRNILWHALGILFCLVMAVVVSLTLPVIPGVSYLPALIIGFAVIVVIYLVWGSIRAFHDRLEEMMRQRFLGDGEPPETTAISDGSVTHPDKNVQG